MDAFDQRARERSPFRRQVSFPHEQTGRDDRDSNRPNQPGHSIRGTGNAVNEDALGVGISLRSPEQHDRRPSPDPQPVMSSRVSFIGDNYPPVSRRSSRSNGNDDGRRPGTSDSHGDIPIFLEAHHGQRTTGQTHSLDTTQLYRQEQNTITPHERNRAANTSSSPKSEGKLRSKFYTETSTPRAKSAASSMLPTLSTSHGSNGTRRPRRLVDQETAYDPAGMRLDPSSSPTGERFSSKGGILSKLGSLRVSGPRIQSRYERLADDKQDGDIALAPLRNPSVSQQAHHSHMAPVGIDISSFEPPVPVYSVRRHEIESPSEENKLEARGELTGGIGRGMGTVVHRTLTLPPDAQSRSRLSGAPSPGWRKSFRRSSAAPSAKRVAQETAQREGQVIAVEESPAIDLSHFEGPAVGPNPATEFLTDKPSKMSYFFPTNSQMPDWRPFPMKSWYVSFLVSSALVLAAISEYLVQKSNINGDNVGLLHFRYPKEVTALDWFTWKYLPTMVLLLYGIMWQAVDFECRRLEPYYQLSKPEGALAAESLNMDYVTFFSYLIPFKAFRHGQWAVVLSSFATILSTAVIPVLSNGAVNVNPGRKERTTQGIKWITFDNVWSRVMEAALLSVAIAGIILVFQLRRKSGLQSDPAGIAGIATLATRSHILNDFRGLDRSSHTDIHRKLKHRRYILHKSSLWQGQYVRQADKDRDEKQQNPHPLALHLKIGVTYLGCLLLFIAIIPILEFTDANIVTQVANWFITLIAILVKLAWTNLETAIRMIEPFYILSKRHAPASVLLLDYTGTLPVYFPCVALINRHWLVAAVGFGSVLTEVLTVCVSSFNVNGHEFVGPGETADTAETRTSFWTSFVLAEAIPVVMFMIASVVYLRRRHAFLPRQPATIASILAFIHQSKMLYEFVPREDGDIGQPPAASWSNGYGKGHGNGPPSRTDSPSSVSLGHKRSLDTLKLMSRQGEREKGEHEDIAEATVRSLGQRGKMYGLGWYKGRDGEDHMGIDEEELIAGYEHGLDRNKGIVKGGIGDWDNY